MGNNVRCKFHCTQAKDNGETRDFAFIPVAEAEGENKDFWKWTPSGELKLTCLNRNVNFTEGNEYYLDITPASSSNADRSSEAAVTQKTQQA